MELNTKKVFQTLNLNKVWVPVVLGLGVIFYLFSSDPDFKAAHLQLVAKADWRYVMLAIGAIIIRDIGYIYRLRLLTHNRLTWLVCFYIIVLWEFSSAVTPSVVGGTLVAVFLFLKEGVPLGKALAYVLVTAIFDNLFFIIAAPLGLWNMGYAQAAAMSVVASPLSSSLRVIFWLSYTLIVSYTVLMVFALFNKPRMFKWLLIKCTSLHFLRRWRQAAYQHGHEIVLASQALKGEKLGYWLKLGLTTLLIWSARYLILNLLIAAYVQPSFIEHTLIFGKHVIMWVIMLISPTPGSSGTAEFFFKQLYGDLLGEYVLITALAWRMLTYYLYLVLGIIILPRWIKRVYATTQPKVAA